MWLEKPPARKRVSKLSREAIIVRAVEILDQEGIDGLTMRRMASELGVTATALYWHVRSKDALMDLAFDHIFGSVPIPALSAQWKCDVVELLDGWRSVMLDHPWSPALVGRPPIGPNVLKRTEFLHAALEYAGLHGQQLIRIRHVLANYVVGVALNDSTWQHMAGVELQDAARAHVVAQEDQYPHLVRDGHLETNQQTDRALFLAGLDTILGGISGARDQN
ncbi:TetR/AcrR family transcriptional regulator C-terminal domain-containing protein [Arthrobacter castelli]|uniref:TetR/AcrR family transcriptional regulator n=1 Tax=Arthrobacter castelli TaxID=271431 RepID=UPI003CCBEB4A